MRQDLNDVFERERPDVAINYATYTKVDLTEEERDLPQMNSVTAVRYLSEACYEYRSIQVHYSTDYILTEKRLIIIFR